MVELEEIDPLSSRGSDYIWYVAYGSNSAPQRLERYLNRPLSEGDARVTHVRRDVFFAGSSKTWGGGVAFLTLAPTGRLSTCAAYRVTLAELRTIFRRENGGDALLPPLEDLAPNEWRGSLLPLDPNGYQGKYNVAMRLDDIEGHRAYTITTARTLEANDPSLEYINTLVSGVADLLGTEMAAEYWQERIDTATPPPTPPLEGNRGFHWEGPYIEKHTAGFPVVRIPRCLAPFNDCGLLVCRVDGAKHQVWASFDLPDSDPAQVPIGLLSGTEEGGTITIDVDPPYRPKRLGGRTGDISSGDVVQLEPDAAKQLGRWALLSSPALSGPVRVQARDHVPVNRLRIAYAGRQLFALNESDQIVLQALIPLKRRGYGAVLHPLRSLGERVFGAPVVALRATEGLVGDDGRMVVRADKTVLDFIGVGAGEHVVVSWGHRSVLARVILQTAETSAVMDAQLREATGRQTRRTLNNISARQETPAHLRLWVSARVRSRLGIPPDTVVRVRRSVRHMLMLSAASAAFPLAALVVGMVAIPTISPWTWAASVLIVVALSATPHRLQADRE